MCDVNVLVSTLFARLVGVGGCVGNVVYGRAEVSSAGRGGA